MADEESPVNVTLFNAAYVLFVDMPVHPPPLFVRLTNVWNVVL